MRITEYSFINPQRIKLRARFESEENYVVTSGESWKWEDAGNTFSIEWQTLSFHKALTPILKSFIIYRFESRSPRTVGSMDARLLISLAKSSLGKIYPWNETDALAFLTSLSETPQFYSFRFFYRWCVQKSISDFDRSILSLLEEIKPKRRTPYQKAYLQQDIITPEDQQALLSAIDEEIDSEDFISLRDTVLLHLGFELAPRPTQIFSLDEKDLESFRSENNKGTSYFTLWLPMAKKISSTSLSDKRPRSISEKLGKRILNLIELNKKLFNTDNNALFRAEDGARLGAPAISEIVSEQLELIGFKKGDGLKFLRHNLAQALADQGSPAEVIAEILGHNSLLPARAYVASTPEIATIKTRALGKNETYSALMKMFLTGKIEPRNKYPKERWPKGIVGARYISGIGACGLSKSTPCPLDPIYSCYTCSKFHPFQDGVHSDVKEALQQQAQYFVDTANDADDLKSNRTVLQLEKTIQAVEQVIKRCK